MEKTKEAMVVPLNSDWTDLGSWNALWEAKDKNKDNNYINGDVIAKNTTNSFVSSEQTLVTTIGVDGLTIISTKDALMVAHNNSLNLIKDVVDDLKKNNRPEHEFHREVYRPWGKYDSLDVGSSHQVKRITVKPGAKLSTQYHHHRSEHWLVTQGIPKITINAVNFLKKKNDYVFIPLEAVHRIENHGKQPVKIIEAQVGSVLRESDIVRYEDIYGRVK